MGKHYKILVVVVLVCVAIIFSLFLIFRVTRKPDFPVDKSGYPINNVVLIDGKKYELTNLDDRFTQSNITEEIQVNKAEDDIEIVLPVQGINLVWNFKFEDGFYIESYDKISMKKYIKEEKDGCPTQVEKFKFTIFSEDNETIEFKLSDFSEMNKGFDDRNGDYTLKIKIIR